MRVWTIAVRTTVVVGLVVLLTWIGMTAKEPRAAEAMVITPNYVEFTDALMRAGLGPEQLGPV